jgi:outer membrane receptor protein involved in Fe transport
MSTPDQLVDPNIKGAVKTQKELGLEVRFLKNRVGLTATYWDGTENEIPYAISIANYSGFQTKYLNTGKITKNGIDLALNLRAVEKTNFSWDLNATYAYLLKQNVDKIADGIDQFTVRGQWTNADGSSRSGTPVMVQTVGKQWGQLYGSAKKIDPASGKYILTSEGLNVNDPKHYFGSVLPKFTGGVQNSFKILKNITVIVNVDYQVGGKFFSLSDMWGTYSGLTAKTSGLNDKGNPNRDAVENGGGIHVTGVTDVQDYDENPDGAPIYQPLDMYVDAQAYWHSTYDNQYFDDYVHDLTFVKLRELSIGYDLPVNKIGLGKYIQGITVSFVAQNPWLIFAKTKDFDPSEISNAAGEAGQFPGVRSFGTNIKVNF